MKAMNELKISVPDGYRAEWRNDVLTLVKDEADITERIKTYEDALNEIGIEEHMVWFYKNEIPDYAIARAKLEIIIEVLNEGWMPDFADVDQSKYYPCFDIVPNKYKENGRSGNGAYCGLAYSNSINAWTPSYTLLGARLTLKTIELAYYAGTQFLELYEAAFMG